MIPGADLDEGDVITEIGVEEIQASGYQPRRRFDEERLEELAASISEHGVVQPVIVRRKDGGYELVVGERRWRAAKRVGLERIPAVVKDVSDGQMVEMALVENLQREDLNPLEEAYAYKSLVEEFGLTQEDVARRVGRSRPAVANALRLLQLSEAIRERIAAGEISAGHAKAILSLPQEKEQERVARRVAAKGLSVRETERLVKAVLSGNVPRGTLPRTLAQAVAGLEERLRGGLGALVKIRGTRDKGEIILRYGSWDELVGLCDLLLGRARDATQGLPAD